jgi:hypothetical protein
MARRVVIRLVGLTLFGLVAWPVLGSAPASAVPVPLVGTFSIVPGSCAGGTASGTYLRMVLSGGSNASGPYFSNSDSTCPDNTYTPLAPGTSGGLASGAYQPEPSPAFDGQGNALAGQITAPVAFEGVRFATATNPVDPQTGQRASAPTIAADGTALSGNVAAFGVSWNNQQFNQGSPKPDGSSPGNTTAVTGTYDPSTRHYTLQWSSQVVGGPFNGFSALWHLTGTFTPTPAAASPPPVSSGAATNGDSPTTSSGASPVTKGNAPAAAGTPATTLESGSTTTTSGPLASGASATGQADPVAFTSRTTSIVHSGWNTPLWLVVVLTALAAVGLLGVVWSGRSLRREGGSQ